MIRSPTVFLDYLVQSDQRRRAAAGLPPHRFHPWQRVCIEPLFNVLGFLGGLVLSAIPWPARGVWHQRVCQIIGAHAPEKNPDLPRRMEEVLARLRAMEAETGQRPAVLLAFSHPETFGDEAWLRFELTRQALHVADAIVSAGTSRQKKHPQVVLTIDPYALETVPAPVSGAYAGLMHHQFLVWDRQRHTQSWIQRHFLLRRTGPELIAWRLLHALSQRPVLLAYPGGVPYTTRPLYAAREMVADRRWPIHKVPRWEAKRALIELLTVQVSEQDMPVSGIIPDTAGKQIEALARSWGLEASDAARFREALAREFAPPVPSRTRLWRVLINRFVRRGRPVMAIPFYHSLKAPHVRMGTLLTVTDPAADPDALARAFQANFLHS